MHSPTKHEYIRFITGLCDDEFARILYCECISTTFIQIGLFEQAVVTAMLMCDQVAVGSTFGEKDLKAWQRVRNRQASLQASTLGSLIRILERHGFDPTDIKYLKWLKGKRDAFIHRLFHQGAWPGDLNKDDCEYMCRQLKATQLWLDRGSDKIWRIFERAGLVQINNLGSDGLLIINSDLFNKKPD